MEDEEVDDWNREDYEIDEEKEAKDKPPIFIDDFQAFLGNRRPKHWSDVIVNFDPTIDVTEVVCTWIRQWNRNPRPLIISGPNGSGKKTLAYMITKEANWVPVVKGFESITTGKVSKKTGEVKESNFFDNMSNKCRATRRLKALIILDLESLSKSTKKGKGDSESGYMKKTATNVGSKLEALEKKMPVIYICKDVWKRKLESFRKRCTMVKLWTMTPKHLIKIAETYAYDLIDLDRIDWTDVYTLSNSCQGNSTRFVHQIKNWHPGYSKPNYQTIQKKLDEDATKVSVVYSTKVEGDIYGYDEDGKRRKKVYERKTVKTRALKNEDECWVVGFNTPMEDRENPYKSASMLFDKTKMKSAKKTPGDLLCSDFDSMETLYDAMWETYPLRCNQHATKLKQVEALERCSRLFSESDLLEKEEHNHGHHSFSGLLVASVGIMVEPYAALAVEPPKIQTTKKLNRSMWETRDSYAALRDVRSNYVRSTCASGVAVGFEFNGYFLPTLSEIIRHELTLSSNANKKTQQKEQRSKKKPQEEDETELQEQVMRIMTGSVMNVASEKSIAPSTFAGAIPWFDFLPTTQYLEQEVWQRVYTHSSMGLKEQPDKPSEKFRAWKYNFSGKKIKPQKIKPTPSSSSTPKKNNRKRERLDLNNIDHSKYRVVQYNDNPIEVFIKTDGTIVFGGVEEDNKGFNVVSTSKTSKGAIVKRIQLKL
jgi:hypothetical protein